MVSASGLQPPRCCRGSCRSDGDWPILSRWAGSTGSTSPPADSRWAGRRMAGTSERDANDDSGCSHQARLRPWHESHPSAAVRDPAGSRPGEPPPLRGCDAGRRLRVVSRSCRALSHHVRRSSEIPRNIATVAEYASSSAVSAFTSRAETRLAIPAVWWEHAGKKSKCREIVACAHAPRCLTSRHMAHSSPPSPGRPTFPQRAGAEVQVAVAARRRFE
jgi:hypothetical protein